MSQELLMLAVLLLAAMVAGAIVAGAALLVGLAVGVRIRMGQPVVPAMGEFRRFIETWTSGREAAAAKAKEQDGDKTNDPKPQRKL